MGQPAARLSDMHTCPMVTPGTPPIPHVGGPIITPGAPNVLIGGLPAATFGCMCTCVGPPDSIIKGSLGVLIGGRPAARMGDNTLHGGVIVGGLPTVLIGDIGMGAVNMDAPDLTLGDFLDGLHVALDIAGLIPVIGEVADGINALIYLGQGDFENAAISGISMIPMVGDAAKGGKYAYKASKSIPDVLKAVDKAKDAKKNTDKAKNINKVVEPTYEIGAKPQKTKLTPGTSEHKLDRWEKYQKRGGQKKYDNYDDWSKQYDTNINNNINGLKREQDYRNTIGGTSETVKTDLTKRQIDIYKPEELYAGQLKTGPVSLTKENIIAINKDKYLVEQGFEVEHILEKGASKPYIEALEKAGIKYHIGKKIP